MYIDIVTTTQIEEKNDRMHIKFVGLNKFLTCLNSDRFLL